MTPAVDTSSAQYRERLIGPGLLIPGTREPGMLTSFESAATDLQLVDGPSTMDAATIADRQREGGGAPSQRRSADERSWNAVFRRLRQQLVMK